MKSVTVKKEIYKIENDLKLKVVAIGVNTFSRIVGLKHSDVSAWLNGHRPWSYSKILEIAEKIDL